MALIHDDLVEIDQESTDMNANEVEDIINRATEVDMKPVDLDKSIDSQINEGR